MHKFISIISGGLVMAAALFFVQDFSAPSLAAKQGGADTRLQKQYQKKKAEPGRKKANSPRLATKQGGAKTRLQWQYMRNSRKAAAQQGAAQLA